ncbi:MAG: type IV pilus assembly protein PilM [Calditrichaeota bacterium]|nr:MAG: type IV pilus assembly protein PilM [Calditrichota bacterium]
MSLKNSANYSKDLDFLKDRHRRFKQEKYPTVLVTRAIHMNEDSEPINSNDLVDLAFLQEQRKPVRTAYDLKEALEQLQEVDVLELNEENVQNLEQELSRLEEQLKVLDEKIGQESSEFFSGGDTPESKEELKLQQDDLDEEPLILPPEPESDQSFDLSEKSSPEKTSFQNHASEFKLESIPEVESQENSIEETNLVDEKESPQITRTQTVNEEVEEEPLVLPTQHEPFSRADENKPSEKMEVLQKESPPVKETKSSIWTTSISLASLFENQKLLGVDLGSQTFKYVCLKKTPGGYLLLDCGLRRLPKFQPDTTEDEKRLIISQLFNTMLSKKIIKNSHVTTAVSGLQVIYHHLRIPRVSRKEIKQAITWACRKEIPFPVESAIIDYQLLNKQANKTDKKQNFFVVAAQKDLVDHHLAQLEKAKIKPAKISTIPVALWNVYKLMVKKEDDRCCLFIDIGAKSSHLVFMSQRQIQFAREISTGGEDFTHAITGSIFVDGKEINVDASTAEKIARQFGFPDEHSDHHTDEGIPLKEISVMLRPVLERLRQEIQRTIDFFKEKYRFEEIHQIYLSGGGALLKNLDLYLTRELKIDVEILNPFKYISTKKITNLFELTKLAPRFAVAVGLALDTKPELNLLPDNLKGVQKLNLVRKIFRYLFLLLIPILVLISDKVYQKAKQVQEEFQNIQVQYKQSAPVRQRFVSLQKQISTLNRRYKFYSKKIQINLNGPNHLKALSHLIPPNMALTTLRIEHRNVKIDEKKDEYELQEVIILNGVAFPDRSMQGVNLARFLLKLEKSGYFQSIQIRDQKIREDGSLEFTLECQT